MQTEWETYEEVANYLLNQMAKEFGLERVEGKQKILGLKSETKWEIDGKGVVQNGDKFVIVECKRYTTSKLEQEILGGLAYRIYDTGALGGIIVTPIGLQKGAKKVSKSENITQVTLSEDSSSTDYVMMFLDQIKVGLSGKLTSHGSLRKKLIRKNGTIENRGEE